MADKIKFELPKFLLYSDNTYVSPSTLPVGPVSKGPNLARGREEYNKGNYTDSDAQAYAKKISGKAEIISPEFDFISAIGLGGMKHFLFRSPKLIVNNNFNTITTKRTSKLISDFKKAQNKFSEEELILPDYAKPNSPINQAKQYLKSRLKNGSLEEKRNVKFNKDKSQFFEFLSKPVDNKDLDKLKGIFGDWKILPAKSNYQALYTDDFKGAVLRNKNNALGSYNRNNRQSIIQHEVGHAFSGTGSWRSKLEGFDNISKDYLDYFSKYNYDELAQRGVQIKNYFGLTSPNQEITPSMLKYAYKNYIKDTGIDNDMIEFFSSISDFDKAAKWLSKNSYEEGGKI